MAEGQDKYQEPVEEEAEPAALKEESQLDPKFYKNIAEEAPAAEGFSDLRKEESLEEEKPLIQEEKSDLGREELIEPAKEGVPVQEPKIAEREAEQETEPVEKPAEPVQEIAPEEAEKEEKAEAPAQEIEQETAPPVSAQGPSSKAKDEVGRLKGLDRQAQIKSLCDLALQKGLDFAVEVAKELDNAYILDEFHDSLVDELYNKLVEKREIKKF